MTELEYTITRKKWNRNEIEALRLTEQDVKMWDKALKLDSQNVVDLEKPTTDAREFLIQRLKNPVEKVKRGTKKVQPVETIPQVIGTANISHSIAISFPAFPGWEVIKELRKLPLKWNNKLKSYTGLYSPNLVNQLNTVLT